MVIVNCNKCGIKFEMIFTNQNCPICKSNNCLEDKNSTKTGQKLGIKRLSCLKCCEEIKLPPQDIFCGIKFLDPLICTDCYAKRND